MRNTGPEERDQLGHSVAIPDRAKTSREPRADDVGIICPERLDQSFADALVSDLPEGDGRRAANERVGIAEKREQFGGDTAVAQLAERPRGQGPDRDSVRLVFVGVRQFVDEPVHVTALRQLPHTYEAVRDRCFGQAGYLWPPLRFGFGIRIFTA